jgi:hypothetical protein
MDLQQCPVRSTSIEQLLQLESASLMSLVGDRGDMTRGMMFVGLGSLQ